MQLFRGLLVVGLLLVCQDVQAQPTDFFWSFHDLNQGAVNGPVVGQFAVGESGSLFLYYSTNGPSQSGLELGAIMDVLTTRTGGIRFTGAEVFNFIQYFSQFECARWGEYDGLCVFGGLLGAYEGFADVQDDVINEWGAFAVDAAGIPANADGSFLIDQGYDEAADAFLFGRVDFEVVDKTRGDIGIVIGPGNGMVINEKSCDPTQLDLHYGQATIEITDSFLLGDANLDGNINLLDIKPFINQITSGHYLLEADINQDGIVDLQDVAPFIELLEGDDPPDNPPREPQEGLIGDINCDGFVDMIDGQCLIPILLEEVKPCDSRTADVNQDGEINLLDFEAMPDIIVSYINSN